jgi:tetratricopeptide (TPR) repeat protein
MGRAIAMALAVALLVTYAGGRAQSPGSAEYYMKYGREYAEAGDAEMAALYFRQGVQMYPQNAPMHLMLAQVLAAKGDKAAAQGEFDTALRLDPSLQESARQAMDYYKVSPSDAAPGEGADLLIARTAGAAIQIGDPIEVRDHASGQWFVGKVTEVQDLSGDGSKLLYKVRYRNEIGETENRFYPGSWRPPTGQVNRPSSAGPGGLGGNLALGAYQCTLDYFSGGTGHYSRQSEQKGTLTMMGGGAYSFRGQGGRYRYDGGSGAITWLSGYLAADTNTTRYRRNVHTSQIDIRFHTASGNLDWSCGHTQ